MRRGGRAIVVGAGLAGLACARELGASCTVLEAADRPGGLCVRPRSRRPARRGAGLGGAGLYRRRFRLLGQGARHVEQRRAHLARGGRGDPRASRELLAYLAVTPIGLALLLSALLWSVRREEVITLNADNVWVAQQSIIDQLEIDANYSGRDSQLGADGTNPDGFLRADSINAYIGDTMFVQNSGTASDSLGGITVGDGGQDCGRCAQSRDHSSSACRGEQSRRGSTPGSCQNNRFIARQGIDGPGRCSRTR